MNDQLQEKLREQAKREAAGCATQGLSGSLQAGFTGEPCRPDIRDRVNDQLARAEREGRRARRLDELQTLLHKHPDVARILDLLEDLKS